MILMIGLLLGFSLPFLPLASKTRTMSVANPSTSSAKSNTNSRPTQRSNDRTWKPNYRLDYLMSYNHGESDTMSCMVCGIVNASIIKADTCKKHISRKHPQIEGYSKARKQAIALKFERDLVKQKDKLNEYLTPMELCEMASYKQAYIVCYHKHSFTTAEPGLDKSRARTPGTTFFDVPGHHHSSV